MCDISRDFLGNSFQGNGLCASTQTPVFRGLQKPTYGDGCSGRMATNHFASTGYVDVRFRSIALSQVNATQTNVVFGVN